MAPLRLITIPISHYCEKARWALQRAGLAFREEAHLQLIHVVHSRRAGGKGTVPVLVAPGEVLGESADILHWTDARLPEERRLYPPAIEDEVRRLEHGFDADLGPHGRLWMYQRLLGHNRLIRAYGATGIPAWERRAFPALLPLADLLIRRHLGITDAAAAESRQRVRASFDAVAERLADGRRHLTGDAFTAADLAFAALSAAVLVPPQYGVPLPQPGELPAPFADEVRALREHPAGRFALRLYEEERS